MQAIVNGQKFIFCRMTSNQHNFVVSHLILSLTNFIKKLFIFV